MLSFPRKRESSVLKHKGTIVLLDYLFRGNDVSVINSPNSIPDDAALSSFMETSIKERTMERSRFSAKGQVTIPKRIREAAHIREGDMLAFDLDSNNRITIKRIDPSINVELSALQETLSEWNSPRDEEAWSDF
jgi:antitoxin PrlF